MNVVCQHTHSANRVIHAIRWRRVLIHPIIKSIFLNIEREHCKISKGKLTEFLIEFMYEIPVSRQFKKLYKLDEESFLNLGN